MDKTIRCRDLGVDCDYTVCARTEEEVLEQAADHARSVHETKGFSDELYKKMKNAIQDGDCESEACFESCCC